MASEPSLSPGLAVFPQFMSSSPQSITMKREMFNGSWNVTYRDSGKPFLTLIADSMSMSHRKHFIDPSTRQEICEMRRVTLSSGSGYSGVNPSDGSTLFRIETDFCFSGSETTVKFVNRADTSGSGNGSGQQNTMLKFKDRPLALSGGEVTYKGQVVANIVKQPSMRGQFDLEIVPGLDPFLILALTVTLDDSS